MKSLSKLSSNRSFDGITSVSEGKERSETSDFKIIHLSVSRSKKKHHNFFFFEHKCLILCIGLIGVY